MVEKAAHGVSMPTISLNLTDLGRILGEEIASEKLRSSLQTLGMEVEGKEAGELKIEVPHNRPDLLGVEGVARHLKGILEIETGMPDFEIKKPELETLVDPSVEGTRPYIVTGVIEGDLDELSLKSLMDLQEGLHMTLGRDRKKISIGAYDLDKIKPPIRYTTTSPKEMKFTPLDFGEELTPAEILKKHPKGIKYASIIEDLDRYPLLIDSEDRVLSMPPIINSESTRVTQDTNRLVVDVTGIDEKIAEQALEVIMSAAGEREFDLYSTRVRYPNRELKTPRLQSVKRRLNVRRANEMIGLEIGAEETAEIMKKMRYDVGEMKEDRIYVRVPFYRTDVMHEVDLIEDLAIGYGYSKLEPTLPPVATVGEIHPIEAVSEKARRTLTGLGFMEVISYTLTSPHLNFELMRVDGEAATISNPISEEYSILRTWILPGLLDVLRKNVHHEYPQRVFEVGDVILLDEDAETGGRNVRRAAAASAGEEEDFTFAKSAAEALLRELRVDWDIEPIDHPSILDGRAAEFRSNGERIGIVGEIYPEVILTFGIEHPVAAFELDLPQ